MAEDKNTRTQQEDNPSEMGCFNKKTIGHYQLIREISRSGMGIVFEAWHPELKRKAAIKILPLGQSPSALERFKREAAILSRIRHSQIAQVYDFGKDDNCFYLVMQYIEGRTLEEKLDKKDFSIDEGFLLIRKTAVILHDLHEQGVIHRDIKPSNIMITSHHEVVLLDFGISKCLDNDSFFRITQSSIGTPAYMPPEFIDSKGDVCDRRSDIYSLGVTLYEIATGVLPFDEPNYYSLAEKIRKADFETPRKKNPDLSKAKESLILKAMSYKRQNRYASAHEMAQDLDRVLNEKPLRLSRVPILFHYFISKSRVRHAFYFFLLFCFLLVGLTLKGPFRKQDIYPEHQWKTVALFDRNIPLDVRIFNNLDGGIQVKEISDFIEAHPDNKGFTWKRDSPGYLVFPEMFESEIRISFDTPCPKTEEFFGVFSNSESDSLSGYLVKIQKKSVSLCKMYYGNPIKECPVVFKTDKNRIILERKGAELILYLNSKEAIRFMDYDPILGTRYAFAGLFFNQKGRNVSGIRIEKPKHPLVLSPLILGQKLFNLDRFQEAIQEYQNIINEYPDHSISRIAYFRMGMTYIKLEEYDKAIEVLTPLSQDKSDTQLLPEIEYHRAISLFLSGKTDEAKNIILSAIHDYPESEIALNIFLFIYDSFFSGVRRHPEPGRKNDKEKWFDFILEHFPNQRPLFTTATRKMISAFISEGKMEKALFYLDRLEEYFPNQTATCAWGKITQGELYLSKTDYLKAQQAFNVVLKRYKGLKAYEAIAILKLAGMYHQTGKRDQAEMLYKKILLDYKDLKEFVLKAEEGLKAIENSE
ncbi:MAG: protein kinase [Candidatus Aureabacteria bacterium]|nr:protein kinase [Candidatus Auribacterota bacterium]